MIVVSLQTCFSRTVIRDVARADRTDLIACLP